MDSQINLKELIQGTRGEAVSLGAEIFSGLTIDSRKVTPGCLFIAIKGENFDGHNFLEQAITSGARGIVVRSDKKDMIQKIPAGVTVVVVPDTLRALQDFANFWRRKFRIKVAGITGSNGKTSTKNFASTLIESKFKVLSTTGNLNNHIGVPLTLLGIKPDHKVAVVEMGMNHAGEIQRLAEIAEPDVSVVTTVGHAHIEFFGSVQGIARAKEEIYLHSSSEAVRVFNLDNPHTLEMMGRTKGQILTFSAYQPGADVCLRDVMSRIDYTEVRGTIAGEPGQARVPIFGRQNVHNLMAASCVALALGVEPDLIWESMSRCEGGWGRNQLLQLDSGATVVFDGYKSDPESAAALIENFSRLNVSGKRILIAADMLELGEFSPGCHEELGKLSGKSGFDLIWFYGAQAASFERGLQSQKFSKKLYITDTYEEKLASEIASVLKPGDVVLIKGSRGMKLERVVESMGARNFDSH